MKRALLLLVSFVSACDPRLALTIEGDGVDLDDVTLQVAVYADVDCAGLRFVAVPGTPPASVVVVGAGELSIPRGGNKAVVVDARRADDDDDDDVVGRGCADVGEIGTAGFAATTVVVRPTARVLGLPATTPVLPEQPLVATVVDDTDTPVAGATVLGRVVDGRGVVVHEAALTSDADGVVVYAPTPEHAGPVEVVIVAERPRSDVPPLAAFVVPRRFVDVHGTIDVVSPVVIAGRGAFVTTTNTGSRFVVRRTDVTAAGIAEPVSLVGGDALSARFLGVVEHVAVDATDVGRTLHWLLVDERLIVVDDGSADGAATTVDEVPLPPQVTTTSARFVPIGACRGDPGDADRGPALLQLDDRAFVVDVAFGDLVLAPVTALTTATPVVGGGCARDVDGAWHRLLFFAAGDGPPLDIGPGLRSIRDAATVVGAALDIGDVVGTFAVRDDGAVLSARLDGGTALLVPWTIADGRLVAVDASDPAVRLPSLPRFVFSGPLYGGSRDVLAMLGSSDDDTATALFASADGLTSGLTAICAPARLCATSRLVDVDDDGRLDLLTVAAVEGAIEARVLPSRAAD